MTKPNILKNGRYSNAEVFLIYIGFSYIIVTFAGGVET